MIKGKWNGKEYKLIRLLGSGNFGKVYIAVNKQGNMRAVKISKDLLSITNEYNAMKKLNGLKFIPKAYDFDDLVINNKIYHFIVMDYIHGQDLKKLGINNNMSNDKIYRIGLILVNILNQIYRLGYKYTDIKLENIIIDRKGRVNFVDFGSLVEISRPTKEYTPTYNINTWNVDCKYDFITGILFSVTMIMVSLIGGKEYNPLTCELKQIINIIHSFSIGKKDKQFLIDGLAGRYTDFYPYSVSLSSLIDGEKHRSSINKIDYLLIASIVSFVFVLIFGIKTIIIK